ncbi:hypothetical protein SUGI_0491880 [Cryptomeria japonica]|nr:hypothetical protein SUGI_0491880 [Cryptomeria japonica]
MADYHHSRHLQQSIKASEDSSGSNVISGGSPSHPESPSIRALRANLQGPFSIGFSSSHHGTLPLAQSLQSTLPGISCSNSSSFCNFLSCKHGLSRAPSPLPPRYHVSSLDLVGSSPTSCHPSPISRLSSR